MAGRIETYIHSDKSVPNKGGAMVSIQCRTDFAARTDEFIAFAKDAAKMAFGAGAATRDEVTTMFPAMATRKDELSKEIGEAVMVDQIVIMTV